MTQVTSGIRAILSNPIVYSIFQEFMGASKGKKELVAEFVAPHVVQSILDIGCGPADILAHLPDVQYTGFDISGNYIAKAREKFGERGTFFAKCLVREDLDTLPKFDLVIMTGVLHHLDDDEAKEILSIVRDVLNRGGRLLTKDPVFEDGQSPIARYLISKDRGQNVRTRQGYQSLVEGTFECSEITVRHKAWPPYTHCITVCTC